MFPFVLIIFVVAFGLTVLLIAAASAGEARRAKANLERLDSAVGPGGRAESPIDLRKQDIASSVPWVDRLLIRLDVVTKIRDLLHQADLNWAPASFLARCFVFWLVVAGGIFLWRGLIVAACLFGCVAALAPLAYVLSKRSKRVKQFEQQLPPALDMMVSALRAGHSLVSSLELVSHEFPAPLGPEFRICFEEQNYGLDLRIAMEHLVDRVPLADMRIVSTAILIQRETGGNLAEVLEKCTQVMRERFRLNREIRVRTAQGRLTGWILSFLPAVLGFLLYVLYPESMRLLWTRPLGQKLLTTSVIMTLIGAWMIRKIIRIRV